PEPTAASLLETVNAALAVYAQPRLFRRLVRAAMSRDWSWGASAERYLEMFRDAIAKRREALEKRLDPLAIVEEPASAPFLARGEPLPARYGRDRIKAMVQAPETLYAYWELSGPIGARIHAAGEALRPLLRLRLHDLDAGETRSMPLPEIDGSHYFT